MPLRSTNWYDTSDKNIINLNTKHNISNKDQLLDLLYKSWVEPAGADITNGISFERAKDSYPDFTKDMEVASNPANAPFSPVPC